jgi:hypothetical protein
MIPRAAADLDRLAVNVTGAVAPDQPGRSAVRRTS